MNGFLEDMGYPLVPVVSRQFRIPPRNGVRLEVISFEYETYTDVDYAAFYGVDVVQQTGQVQHTEDSWYPGTLADVTAPSMFHDFRTSNLVTYPVQVNTALREVRVYSSINVDIRFEGTDNRAALNEWPTSISRTFAPWYRQLLDWDENELDEYQVSYEFKADIPLKIIECILKSRGKWL